MSLNKIKIELRKFSDKEKSEVYPKFFKAGKGEYAEGDIFIGVTVPNCRKIAKENLKIDDINLKELLHSKFHEERLVGLMILVERMSKTKVETEQKIIVDFYLNNLEKVNNWDLVDLSCYKILGEFLKNKDKKILFDFAKSGNLWKERISIITTLRFIKNGDLETSIEISKKLLSHKHDLIHKAIGWVLREVGKKDLKILKNFLKENYKILPRTTLRYAIEKFPENIRKKYLSGKFEEIE